MKKSLKKKKYNTQTSTKEAKAMAEQMKKLKMLLEMIEKGSIDTKEELEVFYNKADIVTDKYGEFTYTDMQFELADKIIYVNITGILSDEENFHKDIMKKLSKNIPLEIQNPEEFTLEDLDDLIIPELKNMYIGSLGSSVTYTLIIDENAKLWKKETIGNDMFIMGEEDIIIHSENNQFCDYGAEVEYAQYLRDNFLEDKDSEECFDEFINEYVESPDFNDYLDVIIEKFHENLEH